MKKKNETDAYYPYVLDDKPGFFLSWLLYRLFRHVSFDSNRTEELRRMHRDGTVVYAIKYRGRLDYLLYHYRYRRARLPFPRIAFDLNMSIMLPLSRLTKIVKFYLSHFIKKGRFPRPFDSGFYTEAIMNRTPALVSLLDPVGFERHFVHSGKDTLQFLLETQKNMEKPVFLVPQLILYTKSPEKEPSKLRDIFFGYKDNPGTIRKIALFFRYHRKSFIDFGSPLDLRAYLNEQPPGRPIEEMSREIRQDLIESIDTQKRVILGPIMKAREQVKENTLQSIGVADTISHLAGGNKQKSRRLKKKAEGYFYEIAADYNIAYIKFFHMTLTWVWKKLFEEIEVEEAQLSKVRDWARKGPVIYIPSHKSHIDYLILNYVLYQHHTHIPRIAAGKNLTFWPMGHIFRKSGAFFIRRTFRGARLYSQVFESYIKSLLNEGHPLEFFIEGGRSRSGKLILPKIGFLSILLKAHQEGYCNDLVFVPASISYDRILEEKSYLKELGGGDKDKENVKQVLKARHFLKRKHGRIYVRFGEPFSLEEYLKNVGGYSDGVHKRLAFHLIRSINKISIVTPLSLTSTAILIGHRRGFYQNELAVTASMLLHFIDRYNIPGTLSLSRFHETLLDTIANLMNRKVVDSLEELSGSEPFFYVEEDKKRELEYYKNSIIHFFIFHSLAAVSLLSEKKKSGVKGRDSLLRDYDFLKNLFQNEFIFEEEKDSQGELDEIISYFKERDLVTENLSDASIEPTVAGYDELTVWAAFLKTFLESYWIAVSSFIQKEKGNLKRGDLLKDMDTRGQRLYKMGLIEHVESISRVNFRNASLYINDKFITRTHDSADHKKDTLEKLSNLSQRIYDFIYNTARLKPKL